MGFLGRCGYFLLGVFACGLGRVSTECFSVGIYKGDDRNMILDPGKGGETQNISTVGTGTGQKEGLLQVIKNVINWVLGLLALIALVILLWGGFQMVTAAGDDGKYDNGLKYVKEAAGGLIMIGVAWFIVSIIFFVINLITT